MVNFALGKVGLLPSDVSIIGVGVGVGVGSGAVAAMRSGQMDAMSNLDLAQQFGLGCGQLLTESRVEGERVGIAATAFGQAGRCEVNHATAAAPVETASRLSV